MHVWVYVDQEFSFDHLTVIPGENPYEEAYITCVDHMGLKLKSMVYFEDINFKLKGILLVKLNNEIGKYFPGKFSGL